MNNCFMIEKFPFYYCYLQPRFDPRAYSETCVQLPCKHVYHEKCFLKFLSHGPLQHNFCPICKQQIIEITPKEKYTKLLHV